MVKFAYLKSLVVFSLVTAIAFLMFACEEQEVYTISQEEELERLITDSEEGRELFRIHDFAVASPYSYPDNDTVYTDFVDSSRRSIDVIVSDDSLLDIGVGLYYFGTATVEDWIYGRTLKQVNGQTVEEENFLAELERGAFFVKLGDNSKAYSGWVLCGYHGGSISPATATVITPDADTFDVHFNREVTVGEAVIDGYLDADDIIAIDKGDTLVVQGYYYSSSVINYESAGGFKSDGFTYPGAAGTIVTDTAIAPSTTDRFWNTLYIRARVAEDAEGVYLRCSFVPFKINP